jgi:hypothetical protein
MATRIAFVAVALEVRVHELAELGDQHLEPEVERARESRRLLAHDLVARVGQRAGRGAQRLLHRQDWARCRPGLRARRRSRRGAGAPAPTSGAGPTTGRADRAAPSRASASRTSRTERASGPCTDMSCEEMVRSRVAVPLYAGCVRTTGAGRRARAERGIAHRARDVVALPIGVMPAATEDDAPPLLPPGVWPRDHGLYVRPRKSFTVSRRKAHRRRVRAADDDGARLLQFATTGLSALATTSR